MNKNKKKKIKKNYKIKMLKFIQIQITIFSNRKGINRLWNGSNGQD